MASQENVNQRVALIEGSHILHHYGILDGFGHLSVRNPDNPDTFFATGVAAGMIEQPSDFIEFNIHDGSPVDGRKLSPYSEHHIHAAMFARFPGVKSVLHSHARDVLPFGICPHGPQLRAVTHTAAFLGSGVPVWDIATAYNDPSKHLPHLLVNTYDLGQSLAAKAVKPSGGDEPYHKVVLQRGHGFVALGDSIQEAVYNGVYAVEGAKVLYQALQLSSASDLQTLSAEEIEACAKMDKDCIGKVYVLWRREIEKNPFWR